MILIANAKLRGALVTANEGDEFVASAEYAAKLIAAGVAHPKPLEAERAVEVQAVEKAVEEVRVVDPETVRIPAKGAKTRKRKAKKVSG